MSEITLSQNNVPSAPEDIFRLIFENAAEAICIADENFRYTDVNPAACELFGYSRDEIVGRSVYFNVHADDRADRGSKPETVRAGGAVKSFLKMVRKDGSLFHAEADVKKISDGIYHSVIRDITAKVKAEEELKKNRAVMRAMIDSLPIWVSCTDIDGNYLIVNSYYNATFKIPVDMIEGRNFRDVLPPEVYRTHKKFIDECVSTRRTVPFEDTVYFEENRPTYISGKYSPLFNDKGETIGLCLAAFDVTQKYKAEEELKRSRTLLRSMIDALELWVACIDLSGVYYVANDYYSKTFKIPMERIEGHNFKEFFPPETYSIHRKLVDECVQNKKTVSFEDTIYLDKGRPTYITGKYSPIFGENGAITGISCVAIDVTQKKLSEKAVQESEERFRKVFEDGPYGMAMVGPSFRFLKVNDAFCMILGYTAGDLASKTFKDITHPDFLASGIENMGRLTRGEIPVYRTEKKYVRKDGRPVWANLTVCPIRDRNSKLLYYLATIEDIDARKEAEEKLRFSEEKFTKVFYMSPDSININRFSDGVYLDCNTGFCNTMGYSREEVVGRSSLPGDLGIWVRAADRERLVETLRANGFMEGLEAEFRRKDGTTLTGLMSARIIEINGEKCILTITRDISELKRYQREIIAAKEVAEETSRAKSNFMANISHELRTPMNGIVGFSNLLEGSGLSGPQREFNEMVRASSLHLLGLINDIFDFSRLGASKLKLENEPFDVAACVKNSVKVFMEQAAKRSLTLSCAIDPAMDFNVLGDQMRFKQVIFNLLSNAVKFTDEGGIEVEAKTAARDGGRCVVSLTVKDTGIGIAVGQTREIFEMFRQLENPRNKSGGGAGLGLTIARGLVEAMGGTVRVASEPGKGSCFSVEVPFEISSEGGRGGAEVAPRVAAAPTERSYEILLAEDDEISRALIIALTKEFGWNIALAMNGREALDLYSSRRFDAIFMDGQMPVMDGLEAAAKIRQIEKATGKHVPIIALTAYALEGDCEKFLAAGMDDYVSKPIEDENILAEKVKNLCEKFEMFNK